MYISLAYIGSWKRFRRAIFERKCAREIGSRKFSALRFVTFYREYLGLGGVGVRSQVEILKSDFVTVYVLYSSNVHYGVINARNSARSVILRVRFLTRVDKRFNTHTYTYIERNVVGLSIYTRIFSSTIYASSTNSYPYKTVWRVYEVNCNG